MVGAKEVNMGQHGGLADNGDVDSNSTGEMDAFGDSLVEDEKFPEPYVGVEFDSENAAKMFYEDYAKTMGFSARVCFDSSTSREFLCSKRKAHESCGAMLRIELRGENKWAVTKFVKDHSHTIVGHNKFQYIRPNRHFAATANSGTETFQGMDIVPSGIMYVSVDGNGVPSEINHAGKNMTASRLNHSVGSPSFTPGYSNRRRTLGRDAQNLLDYFKKMQAENPGFYYAVQLDEENRMANAFWADSRSRSAYSHFADAVILDTTYRINQYRVPFAPFTGVNHHGQTILFGCALLFDESEATFVWLFKTFMAAMNDRVPVSLTTDKDRAIQAAVMQVFPEARHYLNKWNVLSEGRDRMAHVSHAHPNFQVELYNCINMTETIEEFESFWLSILDKYDLKRNDWLQSIYDSRKQWVPVYCRDSFSAAISPSLGFESSFFDGYFNQHTTLPMFFREYERALENSFEREVEADFDTLCTTPVLKTPSPMEKQAARLYTKRIFSKFQEELVETFIYTANIVDGDGRSSTFRVVKFEDVQKVNFVKLNIEEMKASCSCKMFEYSGILCRHVLTVFTVTNVLTLPSHYILKRWTINAKSSMVVDEQCELQSPGSLTARYNNLCKEAIRFAEEGAISIETYSATLLSLKEGEKKVADVKKSLAKTAVSSSRVGGVPYDDRGTPTSNFEMTTPLLWPRQDESIRRFNLNDTGFPSVSDQNVTHMSPDSLKRDGGHSEDKLILPCLKSMTWVMENKNSSPVDKVAVVNLKLQDYAKTPAGESEVKFSLSMVTLEPTLRSMAYVSEQISGPAKKVALINLKLQGTKTTSGESEVKFRVSRDTLGAMLRSMSYIREQLSNAVRISECACNKQLSNSMDPREENSTKRARK